MWRRERWMESMRVRGERGRKGGRKGKTKTKRKNIRGKCEKWEVKKTGKRKRAKKEMSSGLSEGREGKEERQK